MRGVIIYAKHTHTLNPGILVPFRTRRDGFPFVSGDYLYADY